MKKLLIAIFALSIASSAQVTGVNWTNPTNAASLTLTLTPSGGGSGGCNDGVGGQISFTWNGTSSTGTTSGTYSVGQPIALACTPSGGATASWSGGTGSAGGCTGSSTTGISCSFNINTCPSGACGLTANFAGGGGGAVQAKFFGLDFNQTTPPNSSHPYSYGIGRFWDLAPVLWPTVMTKACSPSPCLGGANNAFTFTTVNSVLSLMFTNGAAENSMVFGRSPAYASGAASNTTTGDFSCNSYNASAPTGQGAPGQCDHPTDIDSALNNGDAKGTNQFYRDWVGGFMAHVSGLDDANCPSGPTCYTKTHARVTHVETWNEPDNQPFWHTNTSGGYTGTGTYDQLARMTIDNHFIIVGDSDVTYTLTAVNGSGTYTVSDAKWTATGASNYYKGQHFNITGFAGGNNKTNVICTASTSSTVTFATSTSVASASGVLRMVNPYTGETAAQTQATVRSMTLTDSIDNMAGYATHTIIDGPSYHPPASVAAYQQAFLYCTGNKCSGGAGCTGSASLAACVGPGAAPYTNGINEHSKFGNVYAGTATWIKNVALDWQSQLNGILGPVEEAKPLDGTEHGFDGAGWCTVGASGSTSCGGPYATGTVNANDMGDWDQSAYVVKSLVYSLITGYAEAIWYDWHSSSIGTGSNAADVANNMAYNALNGSTGITCTQSNNGSGDAMQSTQPSLFKCPFTLSTTKSAEWVWDDDNSGATAAGTYWDTGASNNLECHSSVCPTHTQSITTAWNQLHWLDVEAVAGVNQIVTHAGCGSTTCSYAVGIKPILIENQ